jgi:putative peptidoglycan lipid II flippase
MRQRIATAAGLIMLGNIASRLLGVVREQVIAALFGTTGTTDAFVAAATVPTMVYDLLIGGAISAALIPVFADYADRQDELWRVASTVINLVLGVLVIAVAVLVIFAPQLMGVLATGLPAEKQAQAVLLVRLVLPAVLFLGLSAVTTALLYAQQRFALPAFAVALYNLGLIVVAVLFAGRLGVVSLALGLLVGALAQVALQLPGLRAMRYSLRLELNHPGVRQILALYAPVALGLLVTQAQVVIDRHLASQTGEGSMATMRFATTLVQFPLGLVGTAMSLAILPTLARYATRAKGNQEAGSRESGNQGNSKFEIRNSDFCSSALDDFKRTLATGLKLTLLLILPATVGLVVLRLPLIELLFQHGVFGAASTQRTALAFLCYSPSIPFAAIDLLLVAAFYARKNTLVPALYVASFGVLIYLAVALSLIGPLGMPGLVLANSAYWTAHAIVLFGLLWREIGGLWGYGLARAAIKTLVAALVMGVTVAAVGPLLGRWLPLAGLRGVAVWLGVATALGIVVYAAAVALLRVEEAGAIVAMVRKRLGAT